jgi:hypothetical protein
LCAAFPFLEGCVRQGRSERYLVDPRGAAAGEDQEDEDALGIGGYVALDLHPLPGGIADGPVGHVVEETRLAVRPVHAQTELNATVPLHVGAHPGGEADPLSPERRGWNRLRQSTESGRIAVIDPLARINLAIGAEAAAVVAPGHDTGRPVSKLLGHFPSGAVRKHA